MRKFNVVKSLLMNAPASMAMALITQVIPILLGHTDTFLVSEVVLSFFVSYAIAGTAGCFIPADRWGMKLSDKLGVMRGTKGMKIIVNLVVDTITCLYMIPVMTCYALCLRQGVPLAAVPGGIMEMALPVWVCNFFVGYFTEYPLLALAKKICKMD